MGQAVTEETFYEILCRGRDKCGTFVSAIEIDHCPKCRSTKVMVRPTPRNLGKD